MPPNDAQKYLEIVRKRGERKAELKHVYENIRRRKELFLIAYQNLYANKGVLTPGIHPEDTIDGMSLQRIDAIVGTLKNTTYTWTPVRRTLGIPKPENILSMFKTDALQGNMEKRHIVLISQVFRWPLLPPSHRYLPHFLVYIATVFQVRMDWVGGANRRAG